VVTCLEAVALHDVKTRKPLLEKYGRLHLMLRHTLLYACGTLRWVVSYAKHCRRSISFYFVPEPGERIELLLRGNVIVPCWRDLMIAGVRDSSGWKRWLEIAPEAWKPIAELDQLMATSLLRVLRYMVDAICAAHGARLTINGSPDELHKLYAVTGLNVFKAFPVHTPTFSTHSLRASIIPTLSFVEELLTEIPRAHNLPDWFLSSLVETLQNQGPEAATVLAGSVMISSASGRSKPAQLRRPLRRVTSARGLSSLANSC